MHGGFARKGGEQQVHLAAPPPGLLGAQLLLQVLDESVFGALDVLVCGAGGRRPRSDGLLQDGFGKTGGKKQRGHVDLQRGFRLRLNVNSLEEVY